MSNSFEPELDLTLNLEVREYVQKQEQIQQSSEKDGWLSQPEFPTVTELAVTEAALMPNKIDGPFKNKDKYLKTHYSLQREDAVGGLREALQDFCRDPKTNDTQKFSVYDQARQFLYYQRPGLTELRYTSPATLLRVEDLLRG